MQGERGDQAISPHGVETSPAQNAASLIRIVYYTDPLCSWSWAFEPQWRRLRYEFGDQLQWSYRMGGMIPDWEHYTDPLNDVSRPVQMAPQWYQVRTLSGMPIEERIWREDPPTSSYPACLAVKAAALQGDHHGERYLRRVREAVMAENQNVARRECLVALARKVARDTAPPDSFSVDAFEQNLAGEATVAEFRQDLQDIRYRNIGRFPTLVLLNESGAGVLFVGYRPYAELRKSLIQFAPHLTPVRHAEDIGEYVRYWRRITVREVAEALELEADRAEQSMAEGVEEGWLVQEGPFYRSK